MKQRTHTAVTNDRCAQYVKKAIPALLGLLALIGLSYLIARLILWVLPLRDAAPLLLGLPLLLLVLPLVYGAIYNRYRYTREIPYFLLPPDFLLPLSVYPAVLLLYLLLAPRFAVWQWGAQGLGTVQALAVEERWDPDYGTSYHFRVDYTFLNEGTARAHTSYISETLFNSLQPEDTITVHYIPALPGLVTAGDPILRSRQATILLWGVIILILWPVGTAYRSRKRYPPPAAPVAVPQTAVALLARYDLDSLLTEEDDPELWSAVIRQHFPLPHDAHCNPAGLRFAVGEYAPAARLKMQPRSATCFARRDDHYLQRAGCPADARSDAEIDPAVAPTVPLLLLYLQEAPRVNRPLASIIISRPSARETKLPVYMAVCEANGNGSGYTRIWQKLPDGTWQVTNETLNWWYAGA